MKPMSIRIGFAPATADDSDSANAVVFASQEGVELKCSDKYEEISFSLDPTQARGFAALLIRAAEESELMRTRPIGGGGGGGGGGRR
jgi:hypothetical protein